MTLDLQLNDLAPIVANALQQSVVAISSWKLQPLAVGGSREISGSRLFRCAGNAQTASGEQPWSLIIKTAKKEGQWASDDPSVWNYWKRETHAYQSGILDQLPGGIVAPRCYGVSERSDGECWLWLEEIHSLATVWSMERHYLAARHLGQFNGAYVTGYPMPEWQPWMLWGRAYQWAEWSHSLAPNLRQIADTPIAKRWFGRHGVEPLLALWAHAPRMMQAFVQLPICFCHHDAFRNNLLDRPVSHSASETVAIDWALVGRGRIGEEVGVTYSVDLQSLSVPASQARALDQAIFTGYLAGLADTGWRGDERQVRFGYVVNAFVVMATVCFKFSHDFQNSTAQTNIEQLAELYPFVLEIGAEAVRLLDSVT